MNPTRRKTLALLGGAATVGGTAFATGAFDAVSADRTATVSVVNDAKAYVSLRPIDDSGDKSHDITCGGGLARHANPYASMNDGRLELNFDGLNGNGVSRFHLVFSVTNQGPKTVKVGLRPENGDGSKTTSVTLYDSCPDPGDYNVDDSFDVNDFNTNLEKVEIVELEQIEQKDGNEQRQRLGPGESIPVGIEFDLDANTDNAASEFETVVVEADEA